MSIYVCGATALQRSIPDRLRQQLQQKGAAFSAVNHRRIDLSFCLFDIAWDEWHVDPIAESVEQSLTLMLVGNCFDGRSVLTAADLLYRFVHRGIASLQGLGGQYVVVVIDRQGQQVLLVTDQWGLRKMYQVETNGVMLLASDLECYRHLDDFRPRLDLYAAAQLLITSHLCDDHSLLEGVTLLPAGSVLEAGSRGVTQQRYWAPSIRAVSISLQQSVELMHESVQVALQDRMSEADRLIIPLSGGLDSRVLGSLLTDSQRQVAKACTYGHAHCYDLRVGRRIARMLGIEHQALSLPSRLYREYLPRSLTLADGEISIEALPLFRLLDVGSAGQTMISGFLGDWVSAKKLLPEEATEQQSMDLVWQKLYVRKGFDQARYEQVVSNPELRSAYGELRQTVQESYDTVDAEDHQGKVQLLEFWHRQRRYVSYQVKVLESKYKVITPFSDSRLIEQWLNLPVVAKQQQQAYRLLLNRISPSLAAAPMGGAYRQLPVLADSSMLDRDMIGGWRQSVLNSGMAPELKWRLNGLLGRFGKGVASCSGGWYGSHKRGELVHHDEDIRRGEPHWFKQKLLDPEMTDGYFDHGALRNLFDEHLLGKQDHSIRINNVIALAEFRQHWNL